MSEWRSIETAPREDFKRIIATGVTARDCNVTQIIFWAFTYKWIEVSVGENLYRKDCIRDREGWRWDTGAGESPIDFEPTHWMPLPDPPPEERKRA